MDTIVHECILSAIFQIENKMIKKSAFIKSTTLTN